GNLYVADTNNRVVRQISLSTGAVTVFAGVPAVDSQPDQPNQFGAPRGLAFEGGELYVADIGANAIQLADGGQVVPLARLGMRAALAARARAPPRSDAPTFIAGGGVDPLSVVDELSGGVRKAVLSPGAVTTVASAYFPAGVAVDGDAVYFTSGQTISKISSS